MILDNIPKLQLKNDIFFQNRKVQTDKKRLSCSFADCSGQSCPACNFTSVSRAEILNHVTTFHQDQLIWSCQSCQFSTENVADFYGHATSKNHLASVQSPSVESVYVLKEVKCHLCDFR